MNDQYAALRAAIEAGPKPDRWYASSVAQAAINSAYVAAASPDVIRALLAERDALATHQFIGATTFLSVVDGDWADEFLTWYKPDAWISEERACAAFLAAKVAGLAADAQRMDWLEANCTEEPWDLKQFIASEFPDTRLKFKLPPLISTTCINSPVALRDAIDAAQGKDSTA